MLETIKEVLIKEQEKELKKREEINKRLDEIKQELSSQELLKIDREIDEIEKEINRLTQNTFNRIFNGNRLKELYKKYSDITHSKNHKIKQMHTEVESLLQMLHSLSHDEVLIIQEIEKLKNATSLKDLSLTEEEALKILKTYSEKDIKVIVKAVFNDIKNNQPLETKEDIFKTMQNLYQTNTSSFVHIMEKISTSDLVEALIDINIIIDEDKIKFLNDLELYIKSENSMEIPNIENYPRVDNLDNYYYNEMDKALANMEKFPNLLKSSISKIMTLTVLICMAKTNKKENINEK